MSSNWSFDKHFMEEIVSKGYVLLKDPKLPKLKKKSIKTDISTFKRFISGDFEDRTPIIAKPPHDIEKLKTYILKRMRQQYQSLGEKTILWTMNLCSEEIFKHQGSIQKTSLTLDEQVELTLENYSNHSKRLLASAKPIISNDIIRQIQEVNNLKGSSYCYYDDITDLPYIIINPRQAPWITNHETEHAIEELRGLTAHRFYSELGPIFFELLFNDILYQNQGFLNNGDYIDRMDDAQEQIAKLYNYFAIMLSFSRTNFNVSTNDFLNEFGKIYGLETEASLTKLLREKIATPDVVDRITYLYSYLKAIELREQTLGSKEDCAYVLFPYLKTKRFEFTPTEESFDSYRRFKEEMQAKTKKK